MPPPALTMDVHRVTGTSGADLRSLVAALDEARDDHRALELSLACFDESGASHRRLSPLWVRAVGNLLLGDYNTLPLRIALPHERSVQLQLMRNGFYSALAQRPGETKLLDSEPESACLMSKSSGSWSPQTGPVLFDEAAGTRLSRRSYLYSNTHWRAEAGYFRRYQASAAFPWLGDLIPKPTSIIGREVREMFIVAICRAFQEVLDNVSTHAFNARTSGFVADWVNTGSAHSDRSCLIASTTTGGRDSHDRLHFLAIDNGYGIPRTMRWQHPDALRTTSSATIIECALRKRLFDREIDGHDGAGLWSLKEPARFAGGTITVTSEDDRTAGRSAVRVELAVPAVASESDQLTVASRGLNVPWRGTAVHAQLRIPRIGDMNDDQLQAMRDKLSRRQSAQHSAS